MLLVELAFPAVLLFLPERRGVTTIIAVAMLGLGWGGLLSFLVSGRRWIENFLAAALLAFALSIPLALALAVALFTRLAPVTGLQTLHLAAAALYALAALVGLCLSRRKNPD